MCYENLFEVFVDEYAQDFFRLGWHKFEIDYNTNQFVFDISSEYPSLFERRITLSNELDTAMQFYVFTQTLQNLEETLCNGIDRIEQNIFYDLVVNEESCYNFDESKSKHWELIDDGYDISDYNAFRESEKGYEIRDEIIAHLDFLISKFPEVWKTVNDDKERFYADYNVSFDNLRSFVEYSPVDEYKRYLDLGWLD